MQSLGMAELKRIGVVLKRAQYFITCKGKAAARGSRAEIAGALLDPKAFSVGMQQLSLDDFVPKALPDAAPAVQRLKARGMAADVAAGRCGRRHCNVLRSACDRHSLLL